MKNIVLIVISICLFNLSLTAQNKTLDEILEKHKGKKGISEIEQLLDEGINAQDDKDRTALIATSALGHTDTAEVLIESGADVNIKDYDGYTALYWASKNGHTDIVKLLEAALAK